MLHLGIGLLFGPVAHAHPNALRIVAHASETHITADAVQVRYAVSLPAEHHPTSRPHGGQTLAETTAGLTLEGADSLSWSVREGPVLQPNGAEVIRLVGLGPRTSDTVSLHDANYLDLPATLRSSVTVGPGIEVLSCSLFTEREGAFRASRGGQWLLGDDHRTVSVQVRRRQSLGEQLLDSLAPLPDVRSAWDAREVRGWRRLWSLTPLTLGLYLGLATALGLCAPVPQRSARWQLAGSSVGALLLSICPTPLIGVACMLCVIAVFSRRWPALVCAAIPLAALQSPGPVLAACALLGVVSVMSPRRAVLRPGIAILAAVSAARVAGCLWAGS